MTAYLAAEGLVEPLAEELGDVAETLGRLLLAPGPARPAAWAQNVWHDVERLPIASIADAARQLRERQRNWALHPTTGPFRRARLIQDRLPHVSAKPLAFPSPAPAAPLGAWTLLAPDVILAAARTASPFADGAPQFVEDKAGPPNRAYLKLWEALTLLGAWPQAGQACLDLGASPGGWTWVLQRLGAQVLAVDKAPLDPAIAAAPGVTVRQASAFALAPDDIGPVDWLVCDVVCYPARLLGLVQRWRASGLAARMVCTLKFQGATDHGTARAFAAIPGGRLLHLFHNKHELTWLWPA